MQLHVAQGGMVYGYWQGTLLLRQTAIGNPCRFKSIDCLRVYRTSMPGERRQQEVKLRFQQFMLFPRDTTKIKFADHGNHV